MYPAITLLLAKLIKVVIPFNGLALTFSTSFANAIQDLNIVNTEHDEFALTVVFKNGKKVKYDRGCYIDMFSDEEQRYTFYGNVTFQIEFAPVDAVYNSLTMCNTLLGNEVKVTWVDKDDLEEDQTEKDWIEENPIDYVMIRRKRAKEIHYCV